MIHIDIKKLGGLSGAGYISGGLHSLSLTEDGRQRLKVG
jgi:hypothetical protein